MWFYLEHAQTGSGSGTVEFKRRRHPEAREPAGIPALPALFRRQWQSMVGAVPCGGEAASSSQRGTGCWWHSPAIDLLEDATHLEENDEWTAAAPWNHQPAQQTAMLHRVAPAFEYSVWVDGDMLGIFGDITNPYDPP